MEFHTREALKQHLQSYSAFQSCKLGSEAQMNAMSERHVSYIVSADIELVWVRIRRWIAIGACNR